MIPFFVDDLQTAALHPISEVVSVGSNSHSQIIFPNYSFYENKFKKTSVGEKLFEYSLEPEIELPDLYAERVKSFLDEASKQNNVIDRLVVEKVIYSNKSLLSKIERLLIQVMSKNSNDVKGFMVQVLNNEDYPGEYIFISFKMKGNISIRETIEIDDSFKLGKEKIPDSEGLTFSFV